MVGKGLTGELWQWPMGLPSGVVAPVCLEIKTVIVSNLFSCKLAVVSHTYIHTYIHSYMIAMPVHMHACIEHTYIHTYMITCLYMHACIQTYIHMYIQVTVTPFGFHNL